MAGLAACHSVFTSDSMASAQHNETDDGVLDDADVCSFVANRGFALQVTAIKKL